MTKTVNVGVASHITAASPSGPRYDSSLSTAERSSAQNGIWLCQTCSRFIDTDSIRYSLEVLHKWKETAEELAISEIEGWHLSPSNTLNSSSLNQNRTEVCRILFTEVQKASGVIRKLFNSEELTLEDKQEIAFKVGSNIAELADKSSFYIEREAVIHIVGSFIGIEEIFTLENIDEKQSAINEFNQNIKTAYKILELIRDHGRLNKSIRSSIIEYYNQLLQDQ